LAPTSNQPFLTNTYGGGMTELETTIRHLRDRADAAQAAADGFRKHVYQPTDYDAFIARTTDRNLEFEDEEAP